MVLVVDGSSYMPYLQHTFPQLFRLLSYLSRASQACRQDVSSDLDGKAEIPKMDSDYMLQSPCQHGSGRSDLENNRQQYMVFYELTGLETDINERVSLSCIRLFMRGEIS